MTALANTIEAPMQVLGLSRNEATDRARELLSMLGHADKCNHFAHALAKYPKAMPFDAKRMIYGGFKTLVSV